MVVNVAQARGVSCGLPALRFHLGECNARILRVNNEPLAVAAVRV